MEGGLSEKGTRNSDVGLLRECIFSGGKGISKESSGVPMWRSTYADKCK